MSVKNICDIGCLWLIGLVSCLPTLGQISDGLYKTLPDSLRPQHKAALSFYEQQHILKSTPDFFADAYVGELNKMAISLDKAVRKTKDTKQKVEINFALGVYYAFLDEQEKAIAYFKETVHDIGTSKEYNHILAWAYSNMANQYYNHSINDDSTIVFLHHSLQIEGIAGDSALLSQNYNLYSIIYASLRLYEKAIRYGNLAIKIAPTSSRWNTNYTVLAIANGIIYERFYTTTKKQVYADSAKLLFHRVMEAKRKEAVNWYAQCYYNLGTLAYTSGHYEASKQFLDSAALPRYNHSPYMFTPNFYGIYFYKALCLIKLGHYVAGEKLLSTLKVTRLNHRSLMYEVLYEHAQDTHDWKAALAYYKQYRLTADSLDIDGRQGRIFDAEQNYVLSKEEAAVAKLENQHLISQQEKRDIILIATLVLLALAILIYTAYYNERNKRRKERDELTRNLQKIEDAMHLQQSQAQAENALAIADQRRSISQNMHDELSSSLVTLQYYIADLKHRAKHSETKISLEDVESETRQVYHQTRQFMHELHNSSLQAQYNLVDFLHQLTQGFGPDSSLTIQATFDEPSIGQYFTPMHHNELYRIIKEGVANSLKHSGASRLDIDLWYEAGFFVLRIADNGRGITSNTSNGLGLTNLARRMELLQGSLQLDSTPTGTILLGRFPVSLPI